MTTPEKIIAKIEEIEKFVSRDNVQPFFYKVDLLEHLLKLKQMLIAHFNLPTADPPDESPGQIDMG